MTAALVVSVVRLMLRLTAAAAPVTPATVYVVVVAAVFSNEMLPFRALWCSGANFIFPPITVSHSSDVRLTLYTLRGQTMLPHTLRRQ